MLIKKVDAILSPVTPNVAPKIGADKDNPLQQYLADIFTISANLAGICGISVSVWKKSHQIQAVSSPLAYKSSDHTWANRLF